MAEFLNAALINPQNGIEPTTSVASLLGMCLLCPSLPTLCQYSASNCLKSTIENNFNFFPWNFKRVKFILISSFYILPFLSTNGLCHNCTITKVSESPNTNSERSTAIPPHTNITRPTPGGLRIKVICQQSTSIVAHQPMDDFILQPPRSAYKTLFLVQS